MVAALASLLSNKRVRSDLAMTGEISLRGRVLRVGGIQEKVLAAARFGVKHVILPDGNQPDWQSLRPQPNRIAGRAMRKARAMNGRKSCAAPGRRPTSFRRAC